MGVDREPQPQPSSLRELLGWPTREVARWVSENPVVVGWPFNGTRRWFVGHRRAARPGDYISTLVRRQAELHRMLLDHGVAAIVAPSFGELNLRRSREYARRALAGLLQLPIDDVYRDLFRRGVRVRFYGDYRKILSEPDFRPMIEACDRMMDATAGGEGPLILIGLFADNPHETIASLTVELFQKYGRVPDRAMLIEAYYGARVPCLSLYVGFEQPQLFDVPLLATGHEDIYYTLNPTPDVDEEQLRGILFDHLVSRRAPAVAYDDLPEEEQARLVEDGRRRATVGLGRVDPLTGLWRPVMPEA